MGSRPFLEHALQADRPEGADQAAWVTGVLTSFSGPVFAPDDLDRYCLGGGLSRCPD